MTVRQGRVSAPLPDGQHIKDAYQSRGLSRIDCLGSVVLFTERGAFCQPGYL